MKEPIFTIIGYSIDSAIWAREIALSGKKVHYYKTGQLGYPLDDIRDYISYEDVIKIQSLGVITSFTKLFNGTYVFMPYEQLKFVNNRNGLINYPLNINSFESAEEWEQVELCIDRIGEFREELKNATNFLNIYKKFFPKWLYDSFLKSIAVNKWGGFRQSKFTKNALAKEINLSYLDDTNTGTVYKPEIGYEALCEELLNHENIKIVEVDIKDVHGILIKRYKDMEIALMDNRVDYICNYTYGNFDRVEFTTEQCTTAELDQESNEFIDIDEGIVFTPTKDYFCISNDEGDIIKVTSKRIEDFNYTKQSLISPTNHNNKLYNEYRKMIKLFDGKVLNLDSIIVTTII